MSGSASRRVRKGFQMAVGAIIGTTEPGTETGEILGDVLVNAFSVAIENIPCSNGVEGLSDTDMMTAIGMLAYQFAANLDAGRCEGFKAYLAQCVDEAVSFEGAGIEDGISLGFNEK